MGSAASPPAARPTLVNASDGQASGPLLTQPLAAQALGRRV
jgi:hypothetical protein